MMIKILWTIILLLSIVGVSEAQVTQGTVFSKTEDGNGNKITSTVVGPSRGLDTNCLNCAALAGGATEATLLLLNAKFVTAYLDADGIVNQTTTAVHGQGYMYNGATWDRIRGTIAGGMLVNVSNAFVLDATITARLNTLGQKTMANSAPVVLASDQAAIPVTVLSTVATANLDGSCPSGAASFTVAASNASRTWLAVWASPANTDDVYIRLGGTATNADGRFAPGQPLNITSGRIYTGVVDAFPNSGTQAVCVMELN